MKALFAAVIALLTPLASAPAQRGGGSPFPHERHERLFPLCESCHSGIVTGDARRSMPDEASCRECHNGTDTRVITWRRPEHDPGLLRFSHVSHARETDSTGRACATCHATAPGASRMRVQRAAPPACLGCHTHRAADHLSEDNRCAACHVIRGTPARGVVGPDLTHVGSRLALAAATIPNKPDDFHRWIARTDDVKPGVLMPEYGMLPPDDLKALAAYLDGLE